MTMATGEQQQQPTDRCFFVIESQQELLWLSKVGADCFLYPKLDFLLCLLLGSGNSLFLNHP